MDLMYLDILSEFWKYLKIMFFSISCEILAGMPPNLTTEEGSITYGAFAKRNVNVPNSAAHFFKP